MSRKSIKTLIKGTILLAVISLFLEINYADFLNYLIFIAVSYLMLLVYVFYKSRLGWRVSEEALQIISPFRITATRYTDIIRVFSHSGYLQRRFSLETIYIITRRGNLAIRDIETGSNVLDEIKSRMESEK